VYFDEDARQFSERNAAENMSSIRKLALVMLKRVPDKKSLRSRRTKALLDVAYFETVLRSALAEKQVTPPCPANGVMWFNSATR
jgi:hypothetical protein